MIIEKLGARDWMRLQCTALVSVLLDISSPLSAVEETLEDNL